MNADNRHRSSNWMNWLVNRNRDLLLRGRLALVRRKNRFLSAVSQFANDMVCMPPDEYRDGRVERASCRWQRCQWPYLPRKQQVGNGLHCPRRGGGWGQRRYSKSEFRPRQTKGRRGRCHDESQAVLLMTQGWNG